MQSGLQQLPIADPVFGGTFPAVVLYPTHEPAREVSTGPFVWTAAPDAALAPGRFPLCVISHGAGGSHLLYRALATHLAGAGWIVVCPEAPRDNRNDRSLAYTDQAVTNRCVHLSRTVDALLAHEPFGPAIAPGPVSIVGHSLGGCAALALAGGQPWSRQGSPIPVQPDARFRPAVLLAPATAYYRAPGALDRVTGRFLVLAGERDEVTPPDAIRRDLAGLPPTAPCEFEVVRNAGHFSFLSPFPPGMRQPDFPPAVDPPGFDRDAFHRELPGIVASFLSPNASPA